MSLELDVPPMSTSQPGTLVINSSTIVFDYPRFYDTVAEQMAAIAAQVAATPAIAAWTISLDDETQLLTITGDGSVFTMDECTALGFTTAAGYSGATSYTADQPVRIVTRLFVCSPTWSFMFGSTARRGYTDSTSEASNAIATTPLLNGRFVSVGPLVENVQTSYEMTSIEIYFADPRTHTEYVTMGNDFNVVISIEN